jgi:hypothetical protein
VPAQKSGPMPRPDTRVMFATLALDTDLRPACDKSLLSEDNKLHLSRNRAEGLETLVCRSTDCSSTALKDSVGSCQWM